MVSDERGAPKTELSQSTVKVGSKQRSRSNKKVEEPILDSFNEKSWFRES